jgi:hypothetical protein
MSAETSTAEVSASLTTKDSILGSTETRVVVVPTTAMSAEASTLTRLVSASSSRSEASSVAARFRGLACSMSSWIFG